MLDNKNLAFKLNAFVLEFIEVQMKKCLRVLEIGLGPDVALIARLIEQQIDELIVVGYNLQKNIEQGQLSKDSFRPILEVIKFYLDQEALRGKAALFISDNPVHREAKRRVSEQQIALQCLCEDLNTDYSGLITDESLNPAQRQYRFSSLRIAWVHLDYIFRRSTDGLNQMASDIIHSNLVPNGYYDQNMAELKAFKIYCDEAIEKLTLKGGVVEAFERLTLDEYPHRKTKWDKHVQRLQSMSSESEVKVY